MHIPTELIDFLKRETYSLLVKGNAGTGKTTLALTILRALNMDKEALMNNARVLQTWRERSGAKIIFIAEEQKDATLDFLVDGIVELQQKYYDNRIVREIFLSKLRGVKINRPSYIFTLNNNVFRSYDPYRPTDYVITNVLDKKPESTLQTFSNTHVKTGYP